MTTDSHNPNDRVLATLNADGTRRWLRPRLSSGHFLLARRTTAYVLIVIFMVVPYLSINGNPVLRFDILHRRFAVLGHTFLPTDTALMALAFIGIFLTIFLITAIFGRVWCGWACPQTVYMEFLYRPIERLFEGGPGAKPKIPGSPGFRKGAKYACYLLASLYLAHTFLAYFVAPEQILVWMRSSPAAHPVAFPVMAITTGLMMFNFCFFREQMCLVACPYGRFQAAMLDRHSLIITYDKGRGEPRTKLGKRPKQDVHLDVVSPNPPNATGAGAPAGDCIDCQMCVTTCPTGIDIRDGLQMECIGCAQCIDACNAIMDKVGRPRGLIRYSSQAILDGKARSIVRPRIFLYPFVILILSLVFLAMLAGRQTAEARVLPRTGAPFYTLPTGEIANQVRIRIVNRADNPAAFSVAISGTDLAHIIADESSIKLEPGQSIETNFVVAMPADQFSRIGKSVISLVVSDGKSYKKLLEYILLGPPTHASEHATDQGESHTDESGDRDHE